MRRPGRFVAAVSTRQFLPTSGGGIEWALLDAAPIGIFLADIAGRFLMVNARLGHMLDHSTQDLMALGPAALLADGAAADGWAAILRLSPGESGVFEGALRRRDGTLLSVEISARRADDTLCQVFVQDIEDRRRLAALHGESERRLESILGGLDMVAVMVDRDGKVTWCNDHLARLTGWRREEIVGADWDERFVPPESIAQMRRFGARLLAGLPGTARYESEIVTRFGGRRILQWNNTVLRTERGDVAGLASIGDDVTERRYAQTLIQLHALQQDLLVALGQEALANPDLEAVFDRAAAVATKGLGVEFVKIMQLGIEGRPMMLKAGRGWQDPWSGYRVADADEEAASRHALTQREAVIIDDFESETRFEWPAILRAHGIRSGIDVPIIGFAEAYGVISAYSSKPHGFSRANLAFLQSIANTLATAIDRKGSEQRLSYLAQFDALTGLPNRSLLLDRLTQMIVRAEHSHRLVGVMVVDLDRFKMVNETLGHSLGDAFLVKVAQRLRACVRPGDSIGRLGSDEFALMIAEMVRPEEAGFIAQRVLTALSAPFDIDGQSVYLSASLGISIHPSDGVGPDPLFRNATTAMYRVKQQGRNAFQFYLPQMNARTIERLQMETQLRNSIERAEFAVCYQPKVSLTDGRVTGFEALLRWRHPERGLVEPADFIATLEETGLIVPVGDWVIRTVCEQIHRWRTEGIAVRPVAINLSARQFQQPDFDSVAVGIMQDAGVDPVLLEFELTESMLMDDPDAAIETLHRLKARGVHLALDDFGTGYSSFAYLRRFPLDTLKIDRAFVQDVTSNADAASIVVTIIELAHTLKLKVVAEGVESEAQRAFLELHGCDEMQGFLFSAALTEAACTHALLSDPRF